MVTSSSADRRPRLRAAAVQAFAFNAAVLGLALVALHVVGAGVWADAIAFVIATGAMALITALIFLPRGRHLRAAIAAADAFAAGDFAARAPATVDEIGPLAWSLNAAASSVERLVARLRLERAQLEALLNASSDATVAIDDAGNIVYLNDAARAMFVQAGADRTGRPFIEVVRDHDLNDLLIAAARRGERSVRVVAYGQAQRWLQATAVPIERGGDWAALAVFHDLTEVRRLDSMRRDFISNVSHELRTPLAGIRAAAETLQEGAIDDRPAAIEFLGHVQRETDRLTQLVEELLELSRIESGAAPLHFAPVDAAALVREAAQRFAGQADRAGLSLTADTGAGDLVVTGDGERLEQALGNLVANALKFTPSGGSIVVAARAGVDQVAISVADTGIGIEPDQQARVFERFFKADRGRGSGGTGLGLAIVKHIARAHGGSVELESRPGRGSTFTIRLPRR
ncbi:MAG TPA: ATP-binding protein [Dehalococcoidia bacterium]|nr:ATP-binding protein [Dehalococcoidia bacterium]